jgi:hypothetical protein
MAWSCTAEELAVLADERRSELERANDGLEAEERRYDARQKRDQRERHSLGADHVLGGYRRGAGARRADTVLTEQG